MPLIQGKSEKAFNHNVAAERNAGKPMKQSLAIAYGVQRKNRKARGGLVDSPDALKQAASYEISKEAEQKAPGNNTLAPVPSEDLARQMSVGGMVEGIEDGPMYSHDEDIETPSEPKRMVMPDSENLPQNMAKGGMARMIADRIMAKKYAGGGQVLDSNEHQEAFDVQPGLPEDHWREIDDMETHEPTEIRKNLLHGIMAELHGRHMRGRL